MIDLKTLVKSGVHFGHQTSRWSPKMEPYIWGKKNNIHLIDVSKTAHLLEKAAQFLESIALQGKVILWVGTKKAAREAVEHIGQELKMPYVTNRWVGGTLTNYRQVKKSVGNLLHYQDILNKSDNFPYGKKELSVFQKRADKLELSVGGLRKLTWPVGAVVIVDIKREHVVVKEALSMGIPVVAIVDTNSDPTGVDYVIPANDDAPRSINLLMDYLEESVKKGISLAQEQKEEKQAAEEEQKFKESEEEKDDFKKPLKKSADVTVKAKPSKQAVVLETEENQDKEEVKSKAE